MASKQLGKLRQWAGEVISSREKTIVTDEFRELEKDVELRKNGVQKLLVASEAYQHVLSKKKKIESLEDVEKLLPIDTLGVVMITHGEEFSDNSAFGTSLVQFGRAHCKVATLQDAFALTFKDTFMTSLERFMDEIKEYEAQRKKLDSRRLSYDAAATKFEKLRGSKKEKERREAEDEMEKARDRYEESSDDVRAQMHAIQEYEVVQFRELTSLLELEMKFVRQHLNVLEEVKAEWNDGSTLRHVPPRSEGPTAVFQRSSQDVSMRSSHTNFDGSPRSSDDDHTSYRSASRSSNGRSDSRPSSRPASRASRKRTGSMGPIGDKEKEKEKPRRKSVTGWASSAVESVTGRGKKNKDKFAALPDDGKDRNDAAEANPSLKKSESFSSVSTKDRLKENLTTSPKSPARILKPPSLLEKKMVRALYNFSGAAEELSFKAGDEIIVVSEVLDGWWMGELSGKTGLFPTTHVEVFLPGPRRALNFWRSDLDSSRASTDWTAVDETDSNLASDMDDDRDMRSKPLNSEHNPGFNEFHPDTMSITSSLADDDDNKHLMPIRHGGDDYAIDEHYFQSHPSATPPGFTDRKTLYSLSSSPRPIRLPDIDPTIGKKVPPPPPPRRLTTTPTATPPIPERPYKPYRHTASQSVNSLKVPSSFSSNRSGEYDRSPFESATEL